MLFSATVAQAYADFWVGLESSPVQVVQRGASPTYSDAPPRVRLTSTTPRPYSPEITTMVTIFMLCMDYFYASLYRKNKRTQFIVDVEQ